MLHTSVKLRLIAYINIGDNMFLYFPHPRSIFFMIYAGPPRLTDNYQRRYVVAIGGTIRLTCPIAAEAQDSRPAPLYDWTKDGREIHAGWPRHKLANGTLKIKDVYADDAGVYRCQATNGFGSARASLFMQVTGKSSVHGIFYHASRLTPFRCTTSLQNMTYNIAAMGTACVPCAIFNR